jgi:E3 ubiquitin-protein ligase UBR7
MAESSTSTMTSTSKEECIEEETNVITMIDVLKEEQDLEDDAKAVLGASDDQNCTYSRVNIYPKFSFWFGKWLCWHMMRWKFV